MFRIILILLLLIGLNHVLNAQPFDTLLTTFHSINEIYPLDDGTFILIGEKNNIIVERIDSNANLLWSATFGVDEEDDLYRFKIHVDPQDSSIQVLTHRRSCDIYPNDNSTIYTLTFSGQVLDSFFIPFMDGPGYLYLMSGNSSLPRLAYVLGKDIVLLYEDGDTTHLHTTWTNGDTTNSYFLGFPLRIAMCPEGDILVGTSGGIILTYKKINGNYSVIDQSFASFYNTTDLLCINEDFYMILFTDGVKLWSHDFQIASFHVPNAFIYPIAWRSPNLFVHSYSFLDGVDSLYVLDSQLNTIYKESEQNSGYYIDAYAVHDNTTFKGGKGNSYLDGGFLISENHSTHVGPKFYDVELVDFEIGPYDSVHWQFEYFGSNYVYSIPNASVRIKNNCDFVIQQVQVMYTYPFSFCKDGYWIKELQHMELHPGETKSYNLYDIFLLKDYPLSKWSKTCVYLITPDNHIDDKFSDNVFCKRVELKPEPFSLPEFPIQHSPPAIVDEIHFFAPEDFDFDLAIYNLNGIEVFNSHANTSTGYSVDLNFLPPGIYIFQYYLPEKQMKYVEKILKY